MKKGDIICRDLHAIQPSDIQSFIDRISIVERHRVCRALNAFRIGTKQECFHVSREFFIYDIEYLLLIHKHSTGTAGRKD